MLKAYGRIRELRKIRGWSQEVLAQKAGYADKSMISRIENGKIDVTLSQLESFAKVFCVPSKFLLGDVGEEEEDYIGEYAKGLAWFLYQNPEYKEAFEAIRRVKAEDLPTVISVLERFKAR